MAARSLVAVFVLVFISALAQGKNLGVKPDSEVNDELEKTLHALFNAESATETDDISLFLPGGESEADLEAQDLIDHELTELEKSLDKLAEESPVPSEHHRSKRTIGFLTRLGSCISTFMSNPTCWSHLTRAQIRREERRQKEIEIQRMKVEQDMYANALLKSSVNGTDGNSTIAVTLPPRPVMLMMPTTTMRPMQRMFQNARNTLSVLFPRLFGSLRQPGSDSPQMSGLRSRFHMTANDI